MANLRPQRQEVHLDVQVAAAQVRYLNEENVEAAVTQPEAFRRRQGEERVAGAAGVKLQLLPYGLATIDLEERV